MERRTTRRSMLGAVGAGAAAGLAGCLGSVTGTGGDTYLDEKEWEVDPDNLPFPTHGDELPSATVPRGLADGERTLPDDYAGTDLLLTFVYTHCNTMCPRLTAILAAAQDHAADNGYIDRMQFAEMTFDPGRDDADRFRTWADEHRIDLDGNWEFLRPESRSRAKEVVQETYGVTFTKTTPQEMDMYMFAHTGIVLLANKDGYVERAYKLRAGGAGDVVTFDDEVESDLATLRDRED
ncbi:MAG: SCO family protein [Halobacteriales archaeon]